MYTVLASQSPRRRELLRRLKVEFTCISPEIDESAYAELPAEQLVETLSREKAVFVARQLPEDTMVIGADTIVVLDGEILGKPKKAEDAIRMLTALSGKTHRVMTGVTLILADKILTQTEVSSVTFRSLTEEEIAAYVATGEPMDKAGAYGLQGMGIVLTEKIEGDYTNVIGLPLSRLSAMLKEFGYDCLKEGLPEKR